MDNNSSARYNQTNKKALQIKACEWYTNLSEKEK